MTYIAMLCYCSGRVLLGLLRSILTQHKVMTSPQELLVCLHQEFPGAAADVVASQAGEGFTFQAEVRGEGPASVLFMRKQDTCHVSNFILIIP